MSDSSNHRSSCYPTDHPVEVVRGRWRPAPRTVIRSLESRIAWLTKKVEERQLNPSYNRNLDYCWDELRSTVEVLEMYLNRKDD